MSVNAFQLGATPYNAISEIWAKSLLKSLSVVGVYKHIAVDHSSELSANSDAIHLRLINDASVSVGNYYTRGADENTQGTEGTITYTKPVIDKITLQLTDTPYAAVTFEHYALKTADVKFQSGIIERARYQIARKIDELVMNTIIAAVPAENTIAGTFDATSAGEGEMYDKLLEISAILKTAGAVPVSNTSDLFGDKGMKNTGYVVVNPQVMRYILKEPAFVKVDFTDKNAMWKDGIVRGTIAGLVVLESSNLPTTTGTVNVFGGIKEAAHFAVKEYANRMIEDPNHFSVLWSVAFAAGAIVSHPKALAKVVVKVA